jgi:hypothetical protein
VKDGFVSLAFLNLFDKKYIGVINAFEDRRGGGAAYFRGRRLQSPVRSGQVLAGSVSRPGAGSILRQFSTTE